MQAQVFEVPAVVVPQHESCVTLLRISASTIHVRDLLSDLRHTKETQYNM